MAALDLSNPANLDPDIAMMLMDIGCAARETISAPVEGISAAQEAAIRAQAERHHALRQANGDPKIAGWNSMSFSLTCTDFTNPH